MDEALRELINAIKDLSPAVWEAALVQVRVNGWLDLGFAGLFLAIGLILTWFSRWSYNHTDIDTNDTMQGLVILSGIFAALCLIPFFGNLYWGLLYLLSPDWSAIQLILQQVK